MVIKNMNMHGNKLNKSTLSEQFKIQQILETDLFDTMNIHIHSNSSCTVDSIDGYTFFLKWFVIKTQYGFR